jgi:hypothetical protein
MAFSGGDKSSVAEDTKIFVKTHQLEAFIFGRERNRILLSYAA